MATYSDAVKAHAQNASKIYKEKWAEIERLAGLKILPDGTNTASTADDVQRYVKAIQAVAGLVGYTSAKMQVRNAILKLGLAPVTF
jgi:hypothetical protein